MANSLALFLLFAVISSIGASLNIISRSEWGARPPKTKEKLDIIPPPSVIIHHSEGASCSTISKCKSVVKSIQDYHMDERNWADIGYNFLVGGDGNVYEGRGWNIKGAHATSYNGKSMGICFLGNFKGVAPPSKQIQAAKDLIKYGVSKNFISKDYGLLGHRQVKSTDCPGDKLFNLIKSWPHFIEK